MERTLVNLKDIAQAAQDSFWSEVVKHLPLVQSGDSMPMETIAFDKACEDALAAWFDLNATPFYEVN